VRRFLLLPALMSILLTACNTTPSPDLEAIVQKTAIAATMSAQPTGALAPTPTATPTTTPTPTSTPTPTPTQWELPRLPDYFLDLH
jgi:hypothetical protein